MKKLTLIVSAVLLTVNIFAQAPNWIWAKQATGAQNQTMRSVTTDASGNIYATGDYSSTITFGTITLTNAGSLDMFIVKYDSNGNVIWAKRGFGSGDQVGYSVDTDLQGNVYVGGTFTGGTITFGTTTLTNTGTQNMFIVKYDSNGNVLWAHNSAASVAYSVKNDTSGVYITGYFLHSTVVFGTTTLTNANIGSPSTSDIFLVKYDLNGNVLWAKSAGNTYNDFAKSLSLDLSGNVYLTGTFNSPTIIFGPTTLVNGGGADMFITKYSANGNVIWAKSAGNTGYDYSYHNTTDANGNIYVTGYYSSSIITFGTYTLTNHVDTTDMFIAKYNSSGLVLWAKSVGGNQAEFGYNVAVDASGVYVSGSFYSPSIHYGTDSLLFPSGGYDPMFIIKYDSTGNVICATTLESGGYDKNTIATDNSGNLIVGGHFWHSNPFMVGSFSLTPSDTLKETAFIAKYNCNGTATIQEQQNNSSFTISPNPSNGTFQLTTYNNQGASIKVMNVVGEVVYQSEIKNPKSEIDLGTVAKGIYFVQITSVDNRMINKKIIIQ